MHTHEHGMRRTGVALALALTVAGGASAQERGHPRRCNRACACNGARRVAELDARRAGAEAAEAGAGAARMPVVSLVADYTRTNHVEEFGIPFPGQPLRLIYPDVPDNFRSRLDLQWPIYTGGQTAAFEAATRAEKNALDADLDALRADLRLEVTRAFWAAVTARETERVVLQAVRRMDAHVADLRVAPRPGADPAERGDRRRSAALASATAGDRGAQPAPGL